MDNKRTRVAILGCGFAGLRAFYRLRQRLSRRAEFVLIDERQTSLEKPSLPEVALSGKPVQHVQIPLRPLLGHQEAEYVNAEVNLINAESREVVLKNGRVISYDYVIIALGTREDYDGVPGLREYGHSVCDDTVAPRLWNALSSFRGGSIVIGSAKTEWGTRVDVPRLAAACEGPVGEIMFMTDYHLREKKLRDKSTITAFSPGEAFFEDVGPAVHEKIGPLIRDHGIEVLTSKVISRIERDQVLFDDGSSLRSDLTIVIPAFLGNPVVENSRLGDEKGFIPTDRSMRHLDHANIYAVGNATSLSMPKIGHIAILQADIAAASIIREVTGHGEIPEFKPEIFCVMNMGGTDATLILSDHLYGGKTDLTLSGPVAHLMKWSFDSYYFYSKGHMPPELSQNGIEGLLRGFNR
ncbi:MAG: FAD-dependent oxidoreductase [Nitrososphaerota archaeon]|nr:FAD-dependent oxidoreductase [Nitrososphaerota archaeon]